MLAYYASAFGDNNPRSGRLLLNTATRAFTIMPFVSFSQTAKYGVADLLVPARLQPFADGDRLAILRESLYRSRPKLEGPS